MKSHVYQIRWRELLRETVWPIALVGLFALLTHGWRLAQPNAFATPEPGVGQTILTHQWEASARANDTELLLIGDSSCLMDIDARALEQRIGERVLNLGTMSFVRMDSFAKLIERARNERLRRVVIVIHPEMLMRPPEMAREIDEGIFEPLDAEHRTRGIIHFALGLDWWERRFLRARLPSPLPNPYGAAYGFHTGLRRYMERRRGSAVEPARLRRVPPPPELRARPEVLDEARRLREKWPPRLPMTLALAPVAESWAGPNFAREREKMVRELMEALRPDVVLTNLPAVFPDAFFATHTHLNARGQAAYTRWLAEALKP